MQTSHETIAACGVGEYTQHALRLPRKPMHESLRCVCNKLNRTNAPCSRRHSNRFPTHPSIGGQCTKYRDDSATRKKRACFHLVGYKCVPTTSRQYDYDYDEDEQTIPTIPCQCQIAHKSGAKTVCATLTCLPTQPKLSPGMPLNFLFFVSFLDVHVLRIKNRTE